MKSNIPFTGFTKAELDLVRIPSWMPAGGLPLPMLFPNPARTAIFKSIAQIGPDSSTTAPVPTQIPLFL